jgi:L-threonylcarbamoyladenylate synthase
LSRILRCNPARPEKAVLSAVVEALSAGSVVVLPTETQYSLSVRADTDGMLERICRIKKRDKSLMPAMFVKDLEMAKRFCEINAVAEKLAAKYFPGPLTLIISEKKDQSFVSRDFLSDYGFGVRVSSSPVIARVMERVPFPVTATSANISGRLTPPSVRQISQIMGDEVDLYLDGGLCRAATSSTVLKLNNGVDILRHGQIPEAEIRQFLAGEKLDE